MTLFRRWQKDENGAAALEFALVGIPFIVLIIGTIEIGLVFFSATVLEGATQDAARLIRTGQLAAEADPETAFNDALCDRILVIPCGQVVVDSQSFPDFATAATYEPTYDEDGDLESNGFMIGGSSEVVLVRTGYRHDFFTPFVGYFLGGESRSMLLQSTSVFRNEPYEF